MTRPVRPHFNQRIAANRDRQRIRDLERRTSGPWVYPGTWTADTYPGPPDTFDIAPAFENGFVNSGDGTATADQLTRFRRLLGGDLELQLNVTGGPDQTVIFTLPNGFWYGDKQTIPAVDDNGDFTCVTIVPKNDGSGEADVYSGRL